METDPIRFGNIWSLARDVSPAVLGFIPSMLSPHDERPAKAQLNTGYRHGGGWLSFDGFTLIRPDVDDPLTWRLTYPEDPEYRALAYTTLREETIVLFPYAWVAIVQPDGSFDIARLD